ncbi:hypothetical protein F383_24304 [Gossypium arboreum]|uniref:Uncharacterized protein n=1 Tax=Gossypium arboreum TaxID=29729 RepID=A0A0B0P1E9_GOSAR|nr:hypothetical protein F383_24304 [Gossypium arboreum]
MISNLCELQSTIKQGKIKWSKHYMLSKFV